MARKIMGYAIIDWSPVIPYFKVNSHDHDYLDEPGFYIISIGKFDKKIKKYVDKKLQYIGIAYEQRIRERILQNHKADDKISKSLARNPEYKPLVQAGIIIESSYGKENRQLFGDIEKLLIFDNQPQANTNHKEDYEGRNIIIINDGSNELLEKFSYRYE
ncbi:MAG: hypothetical protein LBH25_00885 [Fibromonadaceae bacterium]|jgi:hypothetical protein|nr:hypothetical protein [Fibromonadaceae bacterium]